MTERTLAIIKPDATAAGNAGKIITRIEEEGFNILAIKKDHLKREVAEYFYEIHRERPFFGELIDFMISGPVYILALEKDDAIRTWRDVMGATNPDDAQENTLRKLYGASVGENATHGSDSPETAEREVGIFFPDLA